VECPHLRGACHNLLALYASQGLDLRENLFCLQPVSTTMLLPSSHHGIRDSAIAFDFGVRNVALILRARTTIPSRAVASLEPTHDCAKYVIFQLGVDRC
jgi:hypothetical protein